MAITIVKEPANPLFSKNEIAWKVQTDLTDSDVRIVGHLFVESAPYSAQWDFVKKVEAWPDPQDSYSAWFYINESMDRMLHYKREPSDDAAPVVDQDVCRRIRFEFYEFKRSDMTLLDTLYNGQSSSQDLALNFIGDASKRYLFRTWYQTPTDQNITPSIGTVVNYADIDAWTFSSDFGQYYETTGTSMANVNTIRNVRPGVKVEVYEWNKPTTVLSSIRFVLKGGLDIRRFAQILEDPDYWVDENLENVIDQDGNLILAP